jgi:hypothetical protein
VREGPGLRRRRSGGVGFQRGILCIPATAFQRVTGVEALGLVFGDHVANVRPSQKPGQELRNQRVSPGSPQLLRAAPEPIDIWLAPVMSTTAASELSAHNLRSSSNPSTSLPCGNAFVPWRHCFHEA